MSKIHDILIQVESGKKFLDPSTLFSSGDYFRSVEAIDALEFS